MKKYEEIMDQVRVTPEMKERIMKHVQETDSTPAYPPLPPAFFRGLLPAAACLLLLAAGASALLRPVPGAEGRYAAKSQYSRSAANLTEQAGQSGQDSLAQAFSSKHSALEDFSAPASSSADSSPTLFAEVLPKAAVEEAELPDTEFQNAEELSSRAGFPICGLTGLPFQPEKQTFTLLPDGTAQIAYTAGNQCLIYQKWRETQAGGFAASSSGALAQSQISLDGLTVILHGNGEAFFQALWTQDGCANSIQSSSGLSQEEMLSLIQSLRPLSDGQQ